MADQSRNPDRRQFGRRTTLWHAWIKVAGREREPCVVRNFSLAGALLEFPGAAPSAQRFRLIIEEFGFQADCYIRHRSRYGLGVNFDELAADDDESQTRPEDIIEVLKREARALTN